jgi:hypothetical protein
MVPLSDSQAFLALEPGRGLADLELTVGDRIATIKAGPERRALARLLDQLRKWRRDRRLQFDTRSIILVHRTKE